MRTNDVAVSQTPRCRFVAARNSNQVPLAWKISLVISSARDSLQSPALHHRRRVCVLPYEKAYHNGGKTAAEKVRRLCEDGLLPLDEHGA